MIVTASAANREAQEGRAHPGRHFCEYFLAIDFRIGVPGHEMNLATTIEAAGYQRFGILARILAPLQQIARQLLYHKPIVRHVLVEGIDDVVSVAPGMRP